MLCSSELLVSFENRQDKFKVFIYLLTSNQTKLVDRERAYAPNFNGLVEAGIKSAKHHLKRIMNDSHFTFEELSTIFAQIEAILNSRPLCPLSSSPNDFS